MESVYLFVLQSRAATYIQLSALTLSVYDWLILFDLEVEHVWKSEWTIPKTLFIISRYGPFLDMPITITVHTVPDGVIDYETCTTLIKFTLWLAFFRISISEVILLLRTTAIYYGSKCVIAPLSVVCAVEVVIGIVVTWYHLHIAHAATTPGAVGLNECYLIQRSFTNIFLPNILMLLIFELAIVILTIRSGLRDFCSDNPLLRAVYRDGVGFFLVLFILSLSAILVHVLVSPHMNGFMIPFVRVVHSIICCRILLNLRRAAVPRSASTIMKSASLVFATALEQETNQAETIRFDAYDA